MFCSIAQLPPLGSAIQAARLYNRSAFSVNGIDNYESARSGWQDAFSWCSVPGSESAFGPSLPAALSFELCYTGAARRVLMMDLWNELVSSLLWSHWLEATD